MIDSRNSIKIIHFANYLTTIRNKSIGTVFA